MVYEISGVKIPDSKLAREAEELVRQHETEMLFNHSVRVFVFGAIKGVRRRFKFDPELLYVAALFHDADAFASYRQRRHNRGGQDGTAAHTPPYACKVLLQPRHAHNTAAQPT